MEPIDRLYKKITECHVSTCILSEADCEGRSQDLLLEEILLVEEKDDGGVSEPLVVAN